MTTRGLFAWLVATTWVGCAYGGGCRSSLLSQVADVNIERPSSLAALLQFGSENEICLAVESPSLDLLTRPAGIHASHVAVAYVIQTLLDGARYQLFESKGVIHIRNADMVSQMTQLDLVLPEYKIPRMSVAFAMLGLSVRLHRLADPSMQSMAASISDRFPDDQVGPMEERGRTARELLTLIVSQSAGGAWISGQCAGPLFQRPCWRVIQYVEERQSLESTVGNLVHELTAQLTPQK